MLSGLECLLRRSRVFDDPDGTRLLDVLRASRITKPRSVRG